MVHSVILHWLRSNFEYLEAFKESYRSGLCVCDIVGDLDLTMGQIKMLPHDMIDMWRFSACPRRAWRTSYAWQVKCEWVNFRWVNCLLVNFMTNLALALPFARSRSVIIRGRVYCIWFPLITWSNLIAYIFGGLTVELDGPTVCEQIVGG